VKIIALLAVMALLLLQLSDSIPRSSVGGPLTLTFILFLAMLAVGLYEAWLKKRGPLGWIVNIVISVIGGFVAALVGSMTMEMILPHMNLQGSLVSTQHPLLYITLAVMAVVTVYGSWIALQIVNRYR
jgi:uncharacterized membrane protein YeaQ/YmgE (transglycosylase-associated protein family)